MSIEQNKATVQRFFELYDSGNIEQIEKELLDPNVRVYLTGMPRPLNAAEFAQSGLAYHQAFPDHHSAIEAQVAEGDTVVTRSTFRGTHRGDLQGIPPTGKTVTFQQVNIQRLADGRIVEAWAFYDQFSVLQQLGVIPA